MMSLDEPSPAGKRARRASISAPEPVPLTPNRREEAVRALAAAFARDPLMLWMSRASTFPFAVFDLVLDAYMSTGASWILSNGAGVLLGVPPEVPKPKVHVAPRVLGRLARRYGLLTLIRGAGYTGYSATFPPRLPHYYVYALGVRPEFQGQGLGARLMQPLLTLADARQVPVYLESANPRNLSFYQRLGFRIQRETRAPLRGPRLWLLLRPPRAGAME